VGHHVSGILGHLLKRRFPWTWPSTP
jgi:hypothetical protein